MYADICVVILAEPCEMLKFIFVFCCVAVCCEIDWDCSKICDFSFVFDRQQQQNSQISHSAVFSMCADLCVVSLSEPCEMLKFIFVFFCVAVAVKSTGTARKFAIFRSFLTGNSRKIHKSTTALCFKCVLIFVLLVLQNLAKC